MPGEAPQLREDSQFIANGLFFERLVRDGAYKTQTVGVLVIFPDGASIFAVSEDSAATVASMAGIVQGGFDRMVCILTNVWN